MYVFLIVILVLAALMELLSLRGGAACTNAQLTLSVNRAEPGDPIEATVTAANMGRLPVSYLCVKTSYPLCVSIPEGVSAMNEQYVCTVSDVFRLWGRQQKTHRMTFHIEKRGVHRVTAKELLQGDFLGARTITEQLTQRRDVLVYPRRLENTALLEALGTDSGEASARRWLLRDPVLTLGVREYTGTEPMRTISWNQTARRGELMVREFDYTRSLNCCVVLCVNGLDKEEETLLDTCCSAVRTICEDLAGRGVETVLFTNAALTGYGYGAFRSCVAAQGKMDDALEILARAGMAACCTPEELAEACLNQASDAAAYVVIAPHRGTETQLAADLLQARTGIEPLVIAADELEVE